MDTVYSYKKGALINQAISIHKQERKKNIDFFNFF